MSTYTTSHKKYKKQIKQKNRWNKFSTQEKIIIEEALEMLRIKLTIEIKKIERLGFEEIVKILKEDSEQIEDEEIYKDINDDYLHKKYCISKIEDLSIQVKSK